MRLASLLAAAALITTTPAFAFPGIVESPFFQDAPTAAEAPSPTVWSPGHNLSDMVVVPLTDAPFASIINPASSVSFDFLGGGDKHALGWLTADAAWLVWDPNWRGDVRTGADLMGARTWSMVWSDGFQALAALDTNHDGQLTGSELGGLSLWRDSNCDGISEPDEVMPVEAHGIVGISTRGSRTRPGLSTAPDGVRFDNGRSRPLYDWTPGADRRPHLF